MSDSFPTLFSEDELEASLPQNEIKKDPLPQQNSFPESENAIFRRHRSGDPVYQPTIRQPD